MISVSIRKNDQVAVLVGRDRGKQGRVLMVMAEQGKAIVEGINKVKRHTRPNPAKNIKGGIVEREASIHISNLRLICPECNEKTRVRRDRQDSRSIRVCRLCKASVDKKGKE